MSKEDFDAALSAGIRLLHVGATKSKEEADAVFKSSGLR
jgi:hypothetical protein